MSQPSNHYIVATYIALHSVESLHCKLHCTALFLNHPGGLHSVEALHCLNHPTKIYRYSEIQRCDTQVQCSEVQWCSCVAKHVGEEVKRWTLTCQTRQSRALFELHPGFRARSRAPSIAGPRATKILFLFCEFAAIKLSATDHQDCLKALLGHWHPYKTPSQSVTEGYHALRRGQSLL